MNILMMTNTYTPIVGGLEKSIESFTKEYRKRGHRVMVVAPTFKEMPTNELDVIRVPSFQDFKGTDFSVKLPIPGLLNDAFEEFKPDIVHSHHPFLMGDTALRVAYQLNIPLVYTNHTLFTYNTHYVSDSEIIKRFVVQLSAGYAKLADQVFVPSVGVGDLLRQQGVESPIAVVPSGVDTAQFLKGDPKNIRDKFGISNTAYVVGYAGRLAPEKNLEFLARGVCRFLQAKEDACFLVAGKGPSEEIISDIFKAEGLAHRLFFTGVLAPEELADAFHAMDVFSFASKSETQGIVLTEAMAAGVPVLALDACGVHDLIDHGVNGILLNQEDEQEFAQALSDLAKLPQEKREAMSQAALATAARYSMDICAEKALSVYESVVKQKLNHHQDRGYVWGDSVWAQTLRQLHAEWDLVKNMTKAAASAVTNRKTDAE